MKNYSLTKKEVKSRGMICLPLDGLNLEQAIERAKELGDLVGTFKINDLFTKHGNEALEKIGEFGDIFLDLKYHDIPNTVENYAYGASKKAEVYMFNVHASGGLDMMKAARKGAIRAANETICEHPKIYAVTVLTSLDLPRYLHVNQPLLGVEMQDIDFEKYYPVSKLKKENSENISPESEKLIEEWENLLVSFDVKEMIQRHVLHLAQMADKAGLDGIVCSAAELDYVRPKMRDDFLYVTPGIKAPLTEKAGEDQLRTFTPANAVKRGATTLVIGRAITGYDTVEERRAAAYSVIQDIASVL